MNQGDELIRMPDGTYQAIPHSDNVLDVLKALKNYTTFVSALQVSVLEYASDTLHLQVATMVCIVFGTTACRCICFDMEEMFKVPWTLFAMNYHQCF